tara:strand:- start:194 stop:1384 length:1191 start_codon:yes stop_codon:yes gene_type:complete
MKPNRIFNLSLQVYLSTLFFFAVFFFFQKYNNYTEWTISEWLINYQGGFTRRGLIGEIIFQISTFTSYSIREIILISQIITYLLYFYLIYNFLKNSNKNIIFVFALYSPLFIIYPIAEVEVLGRKEIFTYIAFLLVANIFSSRELQNKHFVYVSILLVIACLIWEGIIIYISFFIFILLLKNIFLNKPHFLIKILLCIIPFIITSYFVIFERLDEDKLKIMCDSINECYGAITYLNRSLSSNIGEVSSKFEIVYLIRYLIIFLIGFFPLSLLILSSKFNLKLKSKNKNYFPLVFIIIFMPSFIFYFIAQDWGRWISASYILSFLTYIYCLKNNLIIFSTTKFDIQILRNKFITIFLFILFSFGWSPKTLINEDVGSIPIYRKSGEIVKYLYTDGGR